MKKSKDRGGGYKNASISDIIRLMWNFLERLLETFERLVRQDERRRITSRSWRKELEEGAKERRRRAAGRWVLWHVARLYQLLVLAVLGGVLAFGLLQWQVWYLFERISSEKTRTEAAGTTPGLDTRDSDRSTAPITWGEMRGRKNGSVFARRTGPGLVAKEYQCGDRKKGSRRGERKREPFLFQTALTEPQPPPFAERCRPTTNGKNQYTGDVPRVKKKGRRMFSGALYPGLFQRIDVAKRATRGEEESTPGYSRR